MSSRTCALCPQPHHARGYCGSHYNRLYKYGDPQHRPARREPRCRIHGCSRPRFRRGWCSAHYFRWRRYGRPTGKPPARHGTAARYGGGCRCDRCRTAWSAYFRGYKDRRRGEPPNAAMVQRFWQRVDRWDPAHCWTWSGRRNHNGYGLIVVNGRSVLAHRFAFELMRVPIPSGYVLDHLCLTKTCVHPWHLEAVTNLENSLRAERNRRWLLAEEAVSA